ncbi:phosphoglucomutase [Coriobacteriales bacterium OH1046]|nr:phosphoglucomutase [Coriobacteriales bacterium OH1046]
MPSSRRWAARPGTALDRRDAIIRFGNDGWHARFDEDFTEENVGRVADALGLAWADRAPGSTVCIGFDTRHNGRRFARTMGGIMASYGLRACISTVPVPTPAVEWACAHDMRAIGAVVLTASERSCEYGGILVRASDGSSASRAFLDKIEALIPARAPQARGEVYEVDFASDYLEGLVAAVDARVFARRRLSVVVDPMYGAGIGHLASALERLGWKVSQIHDDPMPGFSGLHPEPIDPWADKCEQAVVASGAQMGLLLDGDGDRFAAVDETGHLLTPCQITPLLIEHLVVNRKRSGRVITTLSSSSSIVDQANLLGLEVLSLPVGFARLYRELREQDVLIGCEEYGGVVIPSHLFERDGLLGCLLLCEMVALSGASLSELLARSEERLGRRCYIRRDVRLEAGQISALRNILPGLNPEMIAGRVPSEVSHADGLRLDFGDGSWVLMRPSRTDSIVRIYAEASGERERDELLEAACSLVKAGI